MMTTTLPTSELLPDFLGTWPRLKGRQEPEFESKHDGDESEGDRCARFGGRIGLRCMPWEWRTVRAILSLAPANEYGERLWTHRDAAIECTRQQGKTLIIVLLILFHLFVKPCTGRAPTKRIVYTAQRWSTAFDVFNRTWAVIDRVPSLKRRLAEKPTSGGNRGIIKLTNGAKVEFGPRSQDFGRGYTEIDLVIIDEAYDVDPGQEANLTGAQSAAANPQTIYISTPPVAAEHPKSGILAGLHRLGHALAADLYYAIYRAPEGMSRDDPEAWAMAQPSYGVATNEREIRSKRQKAKTTAQIAIFDADYMGIGDYPPDEAGWTSPIPDGAWQDMVDELPSLTGPVVIALDRTPDRKSWALAAAQRTLGGRIHVEIGRYQGGSSDAMVKYLVELVTEWNPPALIIDAKSGAAELKPLLLEAGVEPEITNSSQMALACGGFLDDALADGLSHTGQQVLTDAVGSVAKRDMPGGGFAWDKAASGAIAPLVAATLAHWGLLHFGKATALPGSPLAESTSTGGGNDREFDALSAAF
jgi:hypothetical protein